MDFHGWAAGGIDDVWGGRGKRQRGVEGKAVAEEREVAWAVKGD
jgi:hypothetical protein